MRKSLILIVSSLLFCGCTCDFSSDKTQTVTVSKTDEIVVKNDVITDRLNKDGVVYLQRIANAKSSEGYVNGTGTAVDSFLESSFSGHASTILNDEDYGYDALTTISYVKKLNKKSGEKKIRYVIIPRFMNTKVVPKNLYVSSLKLGDYDNSKAQLKQYYDKDLNRMDGTVEITGSFDIVLELCVYDLEKDDKAPMMKPKMHLHADDWKLTSVQPMTDSFAAEKLNSEMMRHRDYYELSGMSEHVIRAAFDGKYGFTKPYIELFVDSLY
ncbi:MAG: hypothetical protein ACI4UM_02530 [Succinivibrio sp.]